ncbi:hypothetical protein LXL04_024287 [Taraxacum kok-saghyz]
MLRHQYSRLCCLIHNSLHPFTAKSTAPMTKEHEKSLLITLSEVLNRIKHWTGEFGSRSDSDNGDHVRQFVYRYLNLPSFLFRMYTQDHKRIGTISCRNQDYEIGALTFQFDFLQVFLLAVQSPYVRHLAGNVLVVISEFVVSSENHWEEFIQSLCSHFKLIIHKALSPSSNSNPPKPKHLNHDSVSTIILVLRNILKQLKHEQDDDEFLDVYLNTLASCFQDIPWESCHGFSNDFCGHLVQLFCSVISDSDDKNPVIHEIFNIFPRLLTWYQKGGNYGYNQHKILVLMMRLSSIMDLDCETIISWLNLIDKHFQDLLYESLPQSDVNQDDCLKESPFLINGTCHQHLQRRVVFIYLKFSFLLIRLKERKGFMAIDVWLKKHIVNCNQFRESFLRLFIHEDDILFELLLLLTDMPFCYEQQKDLTLDVLEKDIIVQLLDIFDPIHYDHQVLLDYLISKDTGPICAEYLLRHVSPFPSILLLLRIICDKWDSFVNFPFCKEFGIQSSHKRRKVVNDLLETDYKNQKRFKEPVHDARVCLLLLKKSIESLHQKKLFPYNPKVLLRRLTRFQELCIKP